jgi:hypothetical protein
MDYLGGRVLHTRWLQVGNAHSTLEVLGRHVLTKAPGPHPLFDGLREVILAGLRTPPTVRLDEGMIIVSGEGFEGTFRGAHAECAEQTVIVELDHAAL